MVAWIRLEEILDSFDEKDADYSLLVAAVQVSHCAPSIMKDYPVASPYLGHRQYLAHDLVLVGHRYETRHYFFEAVVFHDNYPGIDCDQDLQMDDHLNAAPAHSAAPYAPRFFAAFQSVSGSYYVFYSARAYEKLS